MFDLRDYPWIAHLGLGGGLGVSPSKRGRFEGRSEFSGNLRLRRVHFASSPSGYCTGLFEMDLTSGAGRQENPRQSPPILPYHTTSATL